MTIRDSMTLGGQFTVRRLGFGAMRITGAGISGPPADSAAARDVLRRVADLGKDPIDTADSYGPDVTDELIGETLAPYPEGLVHRTDPAVALEDQIGTLLELWEARKINLIGLSIATGHHATPGQIAWLRHRSPTVMPTPGTSSVAHLEHNVAAADLQLDDADLAQLDEVARN